MKSARWMLWLMLWFWSGLALAASLQSVTVKTVGTRTFLHFSGDGYFTHRAFALTGPDRVVIDFANTRLDCDISRVVLPAGVLRVRAGRPNPDTLRLVFEVPTAVRASTGESPRAGSRWAMQVELTPTSGSARPAPLPESTATTPTWVPRKAEPLPPVSATPVASRPSRPPAAPSSWTSRHPRDVVVVIDPGHGGKDPGAIGPRRSAEKHVVLAIALKLKQTIDRQPGMRAVLTRTGDYYVGLRERLAIARRYGGDIFVSIHADAFINQHSNGASVFALSQTGATSEAARWLAEKENYSEIGGVNLRDLDDQNGMVRSVLIDLSQTATISSSLRMGHQVLRNLDGITRLHNQKVEQARFMVLKSPDIPSILVETGFISNPREERNLTAPGYQQQLAQAIYQGLRNYFWDNPPHGTRIEAMARTSNRRTG